VRAAGSGERPEAKTSAATDAYSGSACQRDASGDKAAARNDDVNAWVTGQRRAPGVENRGEADERAEMLGVGRDRDWGLGHGPEQES
jgi:hypothetical protein